MTTQVTQVAAVEVDTLTGRVHLIKQATCPASGTVVNKLGYEGQCEGGIVQGFGYAVTENYAWTDEAKPATKNFQTYLIPVSYTHLDVYKRQVNYCLTKYEYAVANQPQGQSYYECYDRKTGKPSAEWVEIDNKVREDLRRFGLKI